MRAYNFEANRSNITTLVHVTCREAGMRIKVQLLRARPHKIWQGKNVQNSARFRTTLDFNR